MARFWSTLNTPPRPVTGRAAGVGDKCAEPALEPAPAAPAALTRPSALSWATPIYDAVLSPTDAARRAAAAMRAARMRVADLRRGRFTLLSHRTTAGFPTRCRT
jgi:hypothetical protein